MERYSSWTGRAWLEGADPGARVPLGPGYGARRERLKEEAPFRPWASDWSDGTFEPAPFGLPLYPVLAVGFLLAVGLVAAGTWAAGAPGALAAGVCSAWPLLRLLDHASFTGAGIRLGPPWAARVAWTDVDRVGLESSGGRATVWVITRFGGAAVDVPPVLAPAVRARIRRLGGAPAEKVGGGLDLRYARWRPAAVGIPVGLTAGTLLAAGFTPEPFTVLFVGGLVVLALGALEAAVAARATGWGAGAVAWSTVVYAIVLAALALGTR